MILSAYNIGCSLGYADIYMRTMLIDMCNQKRKTKLEITSQLRMYKFLCMVMYDSTVVRTFHIHGNVSRQQQTPLSLFPVPTLGQVNRNGLTQWHLLPISTS